MDKKKKRVGIGWGILNILLSFFGLIVLVGMLIGSGDLFGYAAMKAMPDWLVSPARHLVFCVNFVLPLVLLSAAAVAGLVIFGQWIVKSDDRKVARLQNKNARVPKRTRRKKARDIKRKASEQKPKKREPSPEDMGPLHILEEPED